MIEAVNLSPKEASEGISLQAVVDRLEEDIVLGYLLPRERVIEDQLMVRFDIKRHLARQALTELARIGLVERYPNRGAAVTDLGPIEVEHIYEMREILEATAICRLPWPLDSGCIGVLKEIQQRHDEATAARDLRKTFRLNIMFHSAIFALCGNPHLVAAIELYGKKAHGVRSFALGKAGYTCTARNDHWQIIQALQEVNRGKVLDLSLAHLRRSKDMYIEAYRERFDSA